MKLFQGDSLDHLKNFEDSSMDSLITDPPAGISFLGKEWDSNKGGSKHWIDWFSEVSREILRVLKPGANGLVWAIPRTSHWTATALENAGFEIRDVVTHIFGSGFPKSMDISKAIDKAAGAEREVVGKIIYTGGHIPNSQGSIGYGGNVAGADKREVTAPATSEAKQWQGWGTALKPASEHWILVRKPLSEKTVAKNVLRHGTGGINIDASRIAMSQGESNPSIARYKSTPQKGNNGWEHANRGVNFNPAQAALGRFPANLIVDESAVEELDEKSGLLKSGGSGNKKSSNFFYISKASKKDRGESNTHPTVKSTKLMEYLITMITPPGRIVLDPFMGSGSTGVAAKRLGFGFVGIEKEKEYFDIAYKRIFEV